MKTMTIEERMSRVERQNVVLKRITGLTCAMLVVIVAGIATDGRLLPQIPVRPAVASGGPEIRWERDEFGFTLVLDGANLRVTNGMGSTTTANGLGNIIIGYNEPRPFRRNPDGSTSDPNNRSGSHDLVVGMYQNFSSFGGLVAGYENNITEMFASVPGGAFNTASGPGSVVSGGERNNASGLLSLVGGGISNKAEGSHAVVTGGSENQANGDQAIVAGGSSNVIETESTWGLISGGIGNRIKQFAHGASIFGSQDSVASAIRAVISGGLRLSASGEFSTQVGGHDQGVSQNFEVGVGNQRFPQ